MRLAWRSQPHPQGTVGILPFIRVFRPLPVNAKAYGIRSSCCRLSDFSVIDLAWINPSHALKKPTSPRCAVIWTGVCVGRAILFGTGLIPAYDSGLVGHQPGSVAALQFLTVWLVEQSLSPDDVFVMAVILSYFRVPLSQQHRVLIVRILGVVVMRGVCIFLDAMLLQ